MYSIIHVISSVFAKVLRQDGPAHRVMTAFFTAPFSIGNEIVRWTRFGKAKIHVVERVNPDCTHRQLHVVQTNWLGSEFLDRRKDQLSETLQGDFVSLASLVH